ncbi:BREX-2 system phosphatase PglZ [Pseudarthrobacter sp. R1]|uniref:BREX-2 system phosphatase PglZ n=1 Tax=Pseudarthrobacter sp. R1 TaxID=2944934 RepID=UPI00210874A6|nr:BREX-2 system phosphatase PglZ [Pseudarthrobacter sp. R1]MCQ6269120.1 BREX-2 system phosphatase PglZ [Pseudarthrobacter sp. R1]
MTQLSVVSKAEILEKIDTAKRKDYTHGVIAIASRPEWDGPDGFSHGVDTVRVHPVVSTLDIRARLLERDQVKWLVLLTDIPDSKLGLGIQSHLVGTRVQPREPWQAINAAFKATSTDVRLKARAKQPSSDYPGELLAAIQGLTSTPAAPSGLLTSDLVFGTLASHYLAVPVISTPETILEWSAIPATERLLTGLPESIGHGLASDVVNWVAEQAGHSIAPAAQRLLREFTPQDILPLGLVAEMVAAADPLHSPWTLLKVRTGSTFGSAQLLGWSSTAKRSLRALEKTSPNAADAAIRRADQLVQELEAADFVSVSDVLSCGFVARLHEFARAIERTLKPAPDSALNGQALAECEAALAKLLEHSRANTSAHEEDSQAATSAMRLLRWLALPSHAHGSTFTGAALAYRSSTGWADRALNNIWTGSSDPTFASALGSVAERALARRREEDEAFARLLVNASSAGTPVNGIENFISDIVVPIARAQPVALIVVDGMGVAAASSVIESISEAFPSFMPFFRSQGEPEYALAAMPSITNYSRTSLFAGRIAIGGQAEELAGFSGQMRGANLVGRLFHKRELESSMAGSRLSGDVLAAVSDSAGIDVFACVLNTIDDSLSKADPMATKWGVHNVAHLKSILTESHRAGRAVIMVSDHGHIVDRREGVLRPVTGDSSARSREASTPPANGEIEIAGDRVIGGRVILALDETLRYRSRTAGYHGGASPAEMVIPITVLSTNSAKLAEAGWAPAPPEGPVWWREQLGKSVTTSPPAKKFASSKAAKSKPEPDGPTLFNMPVPPPSATEVPKPSDASPGEVLIRSAIYKSLQRQSVSTALVPDTAVRALVDALTDAQRHSVSDDTAAAILGVAKLKLHGVFPHVMRLLNVDQYPVITRDVTARKVILDVGLLKDQFQLSWKDPHE